MSGETPAPLGPEKESPVLALERRCAGSWKNIRLARYKAAETRRDLVASLQAHRIESSEHSVVVFGSLARDEFTDKSDIDWTLLVDGQANPSVFEVVGEIRSTLDRAGHKPPGKENQFGQMTFSHDLVHQIGGQDDTNRNTTRRILLLLESVALGDVRAHERVVRCVLKRYLLEDHKFAERKAKFHVPRFLLNDFARYWRTMAVDFAYKSRDRQGQGSCLRNIKLRMSRKLIFVSGLLSCFGCHLGVVGGGRCDGQREACVECLENLMRHTPLEIVARTVLHLLDGPAEDKLLDAASRTFSSYDEFLGILSDHDKRKHLDDLPAGDMEHDVGFKAARAVTHKFRDGIDSIFFDAHTELATLTRLYGVF
jgi:predicted nucleotidyltransferase